MIIHKVDIPIKSSQRYLTIRWLPKKVRWIRQSRGLDTSDWRLATSLEETRGLSHLVRTCREQTNLYPSCYWPWLRELHPASHSNGGAPHRAHNDMDRNFPLNWKSEFALVSPPSLRDFTEDVSVLATNKPFWWLFISYTTHINTRNTLIDTHYSWS